MEQANSPQDISVTLQIILLLTILSLAPSIIILFTSFTRIIIVFSFLRSAMGTMQMPPSQVLTGLALFLTMYIMTPVMSQINQNGLSPYLKGEITFEQFLVETKTPLRKFMLANTRKKDVLLFLEMGQFKKPSTVDEIPDIVVASAFVVSELTTAFQIGFLLYLPFIIVDFVVASVLLSMGMMMLPPVMISIPFKILLFVMVDGWNLIVGSLVKSFY